jgi:hypothetical protein
MQAAFLAKGEGDMKATPASNLNEFAAQVPASKLSLLGTSPDRTTKAARLYVSPRTRPLNQYEMETRGLSYLLKDLDCPDAPLHIAAREMAALVWGPCNLIPVPSHTGDTSANLRLARAIAGYVTGGATVFDLLTRTAPAPSACDRHRARLAPITETEHNITRRPGKPIPCRPSYLIDNVTTSGTTIRACRAALGFGSGLVFADAFHPHF